MSIFDSCQKNHMFQQQYFQNIQTICKVKPIRNPIWNKGFIRQYILIITIWYALNFLIAV